MGIDLISNIQPAPGGAGLFPTHWDTYGRGGYQVRATIVDRDSIPPLNRREGMVAFVVADGVEYRLNADLLTWAVAGGGGGGTLAGDVTGPAASNVVERLTGLAGVVSVPTAALAFGTTPAITGYLRFPFGNKTLIASKNSGGTDVAHLWTVSSSTVLGPGEGSAVVIRVAPGSALNVDNGTSTYLQLQTTAVTSLGGLKLSNHAAFGWSELSTPLIVQNAHTSNTPQLDITIQTQLPYNNVATTGANNVPGSLRIDLGTNTNGYTATFPAAYLRWAGADWIKFGFDGTAAYQAFGAIPATAGMIRLSRADTIRIRNQANTLDVRVFDMNSINQAYFGGSGSTDAPLTSTLNASSSCVLAVNAGSVLTAATTQISFIPASVAWSVATAAPTLSQLTRTTDAAPQNLTIAPQQPFATATGANRTPGSLVLDMGTPTNAGTTYGNINLTAGGATKIQFGFDSNGSFMSMANAAGTTLPAFGAIRLASGANNGILFRNSADTLNLGITSTGGAFIVGGASAVDSVFIRGASFLFQNGASSLTSFSINTAGTNYSFQCDGDTFLTGVLSSAGDVAATRLVLRGKDANAAATGTNRDGGRVVIYGGSLNTTAGRWLGVTLQLGNTARAMLELTEVQAEATSLSRVLAILRSTTNISATQMPTGTGDLVMYVGDRAAAPTVNATGGHIYYSDSASPAWRFNNINLRIDTISTSASAGGGTALPATPLNYLQLTINGTTVKIPYYAA